MKRVDAVTSRTPKKIKNLAAGLQKIENSTKKICPLMISNCFFLESTILLHHLVAIFKKNYQQAWVAIPFELGVTLVFPP